MPEFTGHRDLRSYLRVLWRWKYVFVLILVPLFDLRLILGEEKFLSNKLGEPYQAYLQSVPRLIPRLRTTLPDGPPSTNWSRSVLSELTPIGVFLVTAILWWHYDAGLVGRAYLISFGIALIARAVVPSSQIQPAVE